MVESCGGTAAKVILVVVNTLFLLFGLAIAIAGLVFKFGGDLLKSDIKKVFENVKIDIVGGVDLYQLVNSLATVFIVLGFIIVLIGFLGCFGACCQWRWMLVVYAILVMILLVAQLVIVIMFAVFRNKVDDQFKNDLKKLLKEKYGSDQEYTNSFNSMFQSFQCCGIEKPSDIPTLTLPKECCPNPDPISKTCTISTKLYPGCYPKIESYISTYNGVFIGVGVAVLIFQLLCIIFAFCLCSVIGGEKMV